MQLLSMFLFHLGTCMKSMSGFQFDSDN